MEEDIAMATTNIAHLKDKVSQTQRQRADLEREIKKNQLEERKMETKLMKLGETKRKLHNVSYF